MMGGLCACSEKFRDRQRRTRIKIAAAILSAVLVLIVVKLKKSVSSPDGTNPGIWDFPDEPLFWKDTVLKTPLIDPPRRERRDRHGETIFVVNTYSATDVADVEKMCDDDRVVLCSHNSASCSFDSTAATMGYKKTSYKLSDCFHHVCRSNKNFALAKMDDDVVLNPSFRPSRSMCDVAKRGIFVGQPWSLYHIDQVDTLPATPNHPEMKNLRNALGLPSNNAAICLGYFWYLSVEDTNIFCNNLHYLRHYAAEDNAFTELFARIGIHMHDFTKEELKSVAAHSDACEQRPRNEPVLGVNCKSTSKTESNSQDDDDKPERKFFPRVQV